MKRIGTILISCLVMLMLPLQVFAEQPVSDVPQSESQQIAAEFKQSLGEINRDDPAKEQEYMNTIAEGIEHMSDPAEFAAWAAAGLFKQIFGIDENDQSDNILHSLDALMDQITAIQAQMQKVDDHVIKSEIATELNTYFRDNFWDDSIQNYYNTLRGIEQKTDLTDQERYNKRMQALIFDFTGNMTGEVYGGLCDLDLKTNVLGNYMTQGLSVAYQSEKANLLDMYHYFCKLSYHWEHNAYNDWITFQNEAFSMYMMAATIDRLSLQARIQKLKDEKKEADTLETQLASIKDTMEKVGTIFEDRQVTIRPDNVRYYQYPGHEMLLYTKAKQQIVPEEPNKDIGLTIGNLPKLKGIQTKKYPDGHYEIVGPNYDFWRSFISYNKDEGGYAYCPTAEWFQQVHQDYGGNTSLFDIFFSENEGKFTKPQGANANWEFMIDPNKNHPMSYYDGDIWRADQIVTPLMMSNGKLDLSFRNDKGVAFYTYHFYSNEINEDVVKAGQPFIGIGIVSNVELGLGSDGNPYPETMITGEAETAEIRLSRDTYTFTGKALEPSITVTLSGKELRKGTDYEIVKYENNIAVGTASVLIKGIGEYGGEKEAIFRIVPSEDPAQNNQKSPRTGYRFTCHGGEIS